MEGVLFFLLNGSDQALVGGGSQCNTLASELRVKILQNGKVASNIEFEQGEQRQQYSLKKARASWDMGTTCVKWGFQEENSHRVDRRLVSPWCPAARSLPA